MRSWISIASPPIVKAAMLTVTCEHFDTMLSTGDTVAVSNSLCHVDSGKCFLHAIEFPWKSQTNHRGPLAGNPTASPEV
jgi:hypothetical protein